MRICPNGHVAEGRTCRECHRANYHKHKVLKHTHGRDKTHCKRGHEFTPENTRIQIRGKYKLRICKACGNMHSRNNSKIYKYGITPARREEMFNLQGRCCAVCKSTESGGWGWNIDHDHVTGIVRGILCQNCNFALGHAKDSIKILQRLIEYLRRTSYVEFGDDTRYDELGKEVFVQSSVCDR